MLGFTLKGTIFPSLTPSFTYVQICIVVQCGQAAEAWESHLSPHPTHLIVFETVSVDKKKKEKSFWHTLAVALPPV